MRPRIRAARWLLRLGDFIKSLAVCVMRPDDLIEFSRLTYADPDSIESWNKPDLVESGLNEDERQLLDLLPCKSGRLLLLGVGGGREAIPLARAGFEVTGLDFVADMVARAEQNALAAGVRIRGLVQNISNLDVPAGSFDVVWFSRAMYSCVPGRRSRVAMLARAHRALAEGGWLVCQFRWDPGLVRLRWPERLRKAAGWLSMGNTHYETGDILWGGGEFLHVFFETDSLETEFREGGFDVLNWRFPSHGIVAGAVLRKGSKAGRRVMPPAAPRRL